MRDTMTKPARRIRQAFNPIRQAVNLQPSQEQRHG